MRIVLYGINFAPELVGIGKYTSELAEWLTARGHKVRVVTSYPYYPQWRVQGGNRQYRYSRELWRGVDVWRCPVWVPLAPTGVTRIIHLASFALSSVPVMMRTVSWRPDLVWVVEPPIFCAPVGLFAARLAVSRSWLHIQDYELDAAFALGLLRGDRVKRVVARGEAWLMRRFDKVSTISSTMLEKARDKGVKDDALVLFPNWVDVERLSHSQDANAVREELECTGEDVIALYSGSMGRKHGLELLVEVARRLRQYPIIRFIFCGTGEDRGSLEAECGSLPNVRFLDLQSLDRFAALLTAADIHLLPQRSDAAQFVLPSKLGPILASGKPVIVTANADTELARIVAPVGIVVPPSDARAFCRAIVSLAFDRQKRESLGESGRKFAEAALGRTRVLSQFEADAQDLVGLVSGRQMTV